MGDREGMHVAKVRISVLRRAFYPELADAFLRDGRSVGPCQILWDGQVFEYAGGAEMPEKEIGMLLK